MGDPLRDRRPLHDWVAESQVIEISGELGDFERLAAAVEADLASLGDADESPASREFDISGWMQFGRISAYGHRPRVTGEIEAAIPAICQRCLRPFRLPVAIELRLELIRPGGAERDNTAAQEEGFEAWELGDTAVRPADIVDEALVMALPLVAKHEDRDDCIEIAAGPDREKMTTPFATLRAQMDDGNN